MSETLQTLPARSGLALPLLTNSTIKLLNTHGKQVVDFWAFSSHNPQEYLSMPHTHASLSKLTPRVGDTLYSSFSRPMMTLTEDTTRGDHDTLVSACDAGRYAMLGMNDHPSCADNYSSALHAAGLERKFPAAPPSPLNLFMNVVIGNDGGLEFEAPTSEAGEYVCLRAEIDLWVVMSACPNDVRATNNWNPKEVEWAIWRED